MSSAPFKMTYGMKWNMNTYAIRSLFGHNANWVYPNGVGWKARWVGSAETAVKLSVQQGVLMPGAAALLTYAGFQPDSDNPDVQREWYQTVYEDYVRPSGALMYKMMLPLWPLFGRPSQFPSNEPMGVGKKIDNTLTGTVGDFWKHGLLG